MGSLCAERRKLGGESRIGAFNAVKLSSENVSCAFKPLKIQLRLLELNGKLEIVIFTRR